MGGPPDTGSTVASPRLNTRQKLEVWVERIVEGEGVPPFLGNAEEIAIRTLDLEGSSMALARIVLKDLGLTSQVLRVANSAFYNRSGRPIMSVAHGISLLGWDTLRNLVSTIRFIEHFANRAPGLRELMLLSLLNALHSRDIAALIGYPSPAEAYLCGLFRDLGEVLIGCHHPHEYSLIILAMHEQKIPARTACLRVLDFTWDDVGSRVAAGWNMPSKLHLCLSEPRPESGPTDRCLSSITNYAHDLTRALYRDGEGIDSIHLRGVIDPEGKRVLVSVRDLRRIVDSAVKETQQVFSTLHVDTSGLRLQHQADRARHILESVSVFDAAGLRALDEAVESTLRIVRQGAFELTTLITVLLDAVRDAGFDRVVFALVNEDHTSISGRLASGGAESVLSQFHFAIDRADGLVAAALQRQNDVLMDRSRDDRYDRSALVTTIDPAAFAFFPILIERQTVACLYADRRSASPGLDTTRVPLGRVRDAVSAALRNRSRHARQNDPLPGPHLSSRII